MSNMPRISFLGANRTAQYRLRQAFGRLDAVNQQVSTGRAYNRPSENISASSRAAAVQGQVDQMGSFERSIDDARSHLAVSDTKMSQAVALYQRAGELATQAANSTYGPEALTAIKAEIVQIRDELQSIGNTTYLGQPVFGGLGSANPVTFNSGTSTWNFGGVPTDRLTRTVGPADNVDISITAGEIFSNSTDNIFATLDQLTTDLSSGNTAGIQTAIGKISTLRTALTSGQAKLGAAANRVEEAANRNSAMKITFTAELSKLQEVDLADAITDQGRLSIAYQSALGVTARAQEKTLLDWLR